MEWPSFQNDSWEITFPSKMRLEFITFSSSVSLNRLWEQMGVLHMAKRAIARQNKSFFIGLEDGFSVLSFYNQDIGIR